MFNPFNQAIKKYVFNLLPESYTTDLDQVLDRVCLTIANENEAKALMTLFGTLYGTAYYKAMKDIAKKLEEDQGIKMKITQPKT